MVILDQTSPEWLVSALRQALETKEPAVGNIDGARPAGVLVPLYMKSGEWTVLLNVRSEHVGDHKGEIAFPGGSLEPEDKDLHACALRETWEEMGILPEDVDVLGELEAVNTLRSKFVVWPFVGVIPYPYAFTPDPREVAEVVELPLAHALDPANTRYEGRLLADGSVHWRPAYAHGPYLVYGATAMILAQLLTLVRTVAGVSPLADSAQRPD